MSVYCVAFLQPKPRPPSYNVKFSHLRVNIYIYIYFKEAVGGIDRRDRGIWSGVVERLVEN